VRAPAEKALVRSDLGSAVTHLSQGLLQRQAVVLDQVEQRHDRVQREVG
jgi:hypothetical protein